MANSTSKLEKIIATQREGKTNEYDAVLYEAGTLNGRREMGRDALSWLEKKYLDPSIERGDPKAEAILELARELSKHIKVVTK